MNPINTQAMPSAVTAAPFANTNPAAATAIPSTQFNHFHVVGDGDCLFRAMYMGLAHQPGVEASEEQVMNLRQYLANYVYQHQDTLASHPAFEGRQGVLNLYDLLLTPGQWNHNAGDLVAPLLAQVSGRPLAVLQATQQGSAYHVRQVFPAENPTLPIGAPRTDEPTICLAHINGNHYGYLEERYPNVLFNALNQSQNAPQPELNSSAPPPREVGPMDTGESKLSKGQKSKRRLNSAQEETLKQFWAANPSWGERKLAHEFSKQYPDLGVTRDVVSGLKKRNPSFLQLGIGSSLKKKKDNVAQDNAVVRFWLDNPCWGILKVVCEFNRHNPGANLTVGDARRIKVSHPGLQGFKLGDINKAQKEFDAEHKQALFDLWRDNPTWAYKKVVSEFKKLNPEVNLTQSNVQDIRASQADLQKLNPSKSPKTISDDKALALLQLWCANPGWGYQKIANEYNKHNPEANISTADLQRIRRSHPSFRGLKLGSQKTQKKLNDAQEQMLVELWWKNPSWSYRKVTREFNQRNPGLNVSPPIVWGMKAKHPALQGINFGMPKNGKRLREEQEKALVQFWLNNPGWGEQKIVHEFLKENPGIPLTKSIAHGLKTRYPDLRELPPGSTMPKKKLNNEQERELLQLLRNNPHLNNKKLIQEYMARNPGVSISRNIIYRLKLQNPDLIRQSSRPLTNTLPFDIPEDDVLTPRTLSALNDLFTTDDLMDQAIRDNAAAEEDTLSQNTFTALSDIVDMDELSNEQYLSSDTSGDDGSQGTFGGLEDFEDISRLRG